MVSLKRIKWQFKDPFTLITHVGQEIVLTMSSPVYVKQLVHGAWLFMLSTACCKQLHVQPSLVDLSVARRA
eukprot:12925475-Prorocentrum_lima.AAC.1